MRLSGTKATAIHQYRGLGNQLWDLAGNRPSLDLPFADSKSLVDATTGTNLIDFTRASSGTYVDSQGVIRTAVTNLLLWSEEFDDASWTKTNTTVVTNSIANPLTGKFTADTLVATANLSGHYINRSITSSANSTVSVYAKAAGYNYIEINGYTNSVNQNRVTVNLTNGTVASNTNSLPVSVTSVENGWYRIAITLTNGGSFVTFAISADGTVNDTFTGDGTSGIYLWGAQLEQSSTVGEYVKTTSTINSAPRFDHDPTTGESLGLLVEEARTNLLLRSEEFDNASWIKQNSHPVTPNTATAPDGTLSADTLRRTANNQYVLQANTAVGTFTLSAWVRVPSGTQTFTMQGYNSTNGVIGGTQFTATTEWQRFSITGTNTTTTNWYPCIPDSLNTDYYLWGAQLEAGSFPTSYIPTTTATVTRAADVASISGSNYSSWANNTSGTLFASGERLSGASSGTTTVGQIDDGTTNNRYLIGIGAANVVNQTFAAAIIGNTQDVALFATSVFGVNRASFGFALNDCAGSLNGATPLTDTSAALPLNLSTFRIGSNGGNYFNGHIRRLTFWPQRLPNETLQTITQ